MKVKWAARIVKRAEMLAEKRAHILREVVDGTGAGISIEEDHSSMQTGIRLWFSDLERTHSPFVTLRQYGLNRMVATLGFGSFAAGTIHQMSLADPEAKQLARALVASITSSATVTISENQSLDNWVIKDGAFSITAEKRGIEGRFADEVLSSTCRELVFPILAAMAELYGYDPAPEALPAGQEALLEGGVSLTLVRKRERNPRNRLLCLRIHGSTCSVCGMDPMERYGEAGTIIEVHHLHPLALSGGPRPYDPSTDLVPLCPNCHRAVHTRRPEPWSPEEVREKLAP